MTTSLETAGRAQPISRRLAVDAFHQGIDAHRDSHSRSACPYSSASDDMSIVFASAWWHRGWSRAERAES